MATGGVGAPLAESDELTSQDKVPPKRARLHTKKDRILITSYHSYIESMLKNQERHADRALSNATAYKKRLHTYNELPQLR